MIPFLRIKSITLLIPIIIAITSSLGDEIQTKPSLSACKPVLLENCAANFCIVNITVINKCPSNTDGELKKKCENFTDVDLFTNTFLFRPVTDELDNVTYWNLYCAKCNRKNLDTGILKFWTLRAYHSNDSRPNSSFISEVNVAVRKKIQVDNNTKQLISNIHNLDRKIIPLRYLPIDLKNSSYETCSLNENEPVELFMKSNAEKFFPLPKEFNCTEKRFCSNKPQPKTCIYFDSNNLPCRDNEFFVEKIDFIYDGSKIIINDGRTFDSDRYFNAAEVQGILLCSLRDNRDYFTRFFHGFVTYAKYVSTILLFVFLVMKTNKKNFRNLPKLILYSYCAASLAVYLFQIFRHLIADRLIFKTYIILYIYLCHALWAVIISYEYWYVISSTLKFERYKFKLRQYCIYGSIGWLLPAILLFGVYFSLTEEDKSAVCPKFENLHYSGLTEYLSELARILHLILVALYVLIFLILIPVMALQGCNFIRLAKNRRSIKQQSAARKRNATRTQSASEMDYLLIFTKIAYLMGFHWMVLSIMVVVAISFDHSASVNSVLSDVGSLLFALHGTFIFIVFGFGGVRATYRSTRSFSFKTLSTRSSRMNESESVDMRPRAGTD